MTLGRGLLIGGGLLVGGYVLYQILRPATVAPSRVGSTTYTTAAGTIVSGLSSLGALITNAVSPAGGTGTGSGSFWSSPAAAAANYNDPNAYSTSVGSYSAGAYANYAYADSHPGTALPDGVYGPPVPADGLVGGGDSVTSSSVEYV